MGLELLINQRRAFVASNDNSTASEMRTFEKQKNNFADFRMDIDGKTFFFGGERMPKNRYISEDIISLTPIVKYARKKTIVTTPVNTLDEVIEQWSLTGYEIHISGLLVDTRNQQYPKKQIQNLRAFFEINQTATVTGELFLDLDIQDIYLLSMNVEPFVGFPDTVHFELQAKSVKPLLFSLNP